MFIGEVSKKTGFSRDTIRFYEKVGVIGKNLSRGENRYRQYGDTDILRLQRIKKIKAYGFTLTEIKKILEAWETDTVTCNAMLKIARKKTREIEIKIREMERIKERISVEFKRCALQCYNNRCKIL
ncbi:MerR family transcriptional regulator [bacterium]|nr:MerR family transcriptional regulator [bacterium]